MKFELDADERKKYDAWVKAHIEKQHGGEFPYTGAVGGLFSFTITPTGLGTIVSVECGMCKLNTLKDKLIAATYNKREDTDVYSECLTDFSEW